MFDVCSKCGAITNPRRDGAHNCEENTKRQPKKLNHSPLNFTLAKGVYPDQIYIKDALGRIVCDFANRENGKGNSEFIVQVCNSSYGQQRTIKELLEAAKLATAVLGTSSGNIGQNAAAKLKAAIVKAEGRS